MAELTSIKINAGNDRNGNPRRGWIILTATPMWGYPAIVDFIDEGYVGSSAITDAGYPRELADAPELRVVPSEYRRLLKLRRSEQVV